MTAALVAALLAAAPDNGNFVAPNEQIVVQVRAGNSMGSGVVLQTSPLIVATCLHVIQGASAISVTAPAAPGLKANVSRVAVAPDSDLAFLWSRDAWASDAVEPWLDYVLRNGDPVVALGYGDGLGNYLTPVSMFYRDRRRMYAFASDLGWDTIRGSFMVSHSQNGQVSFRAGDSGGALLDQRGRLVGIIGGYMKRKSTTDNVANFAVVVPGPIPNDADFRPRQGETAPLAQFTNVSLPYGDDPSLTRSSIIFPTRTVQADAGLAIPQPESPLGAACFNAVTAALSVAGTDLPQKLDGGTADCAKSWATIRAVAVAAEVERERISVLRDYALRVQRLGDEVQADFAAAIDKVSSTSSCGEKPCPAVDKSMLAHECDTAACGTFAQLDHAEQQQKWNAFYSAYSKTAKQALSVKQITKLPASKTLQKVEVPKQAGAELEKIAAAVAKAHDPTLKARANQEKWTDALVEWTLVPADKGTPAQRLLAEADDRQKVLAGLAKCKRDMLLQLASGKPLRCD